MSFVKGAWGLELRLRRLEVKRILRVSGEESPVVSQENVLVGNRDWANNEVILSPCSLPSFFHMTQ